MVLHPRSLALLAFLVFGAKASAIHKSCEIVFDGRLSLDVKPADFDKNASIYDHQFVHGESTYMFAKRAGFRVLCVLYLFSPDQTWAEIIKFPVVLPSLVCTRISNLYFQN